MVKPELTDCVFPVCMVGGFSGAVYVGCPSAGQSGLRQAADRERSEHASLPHPLQTGGALQHGTSAPPWLTALNSDLSLTSCHMECIKQS